MESNLDSFVKAYLACALWSSSDNSNESGGEPLDKNYDEGDIDEAVLVDMRKDCEQFLSSPAVCAAIETRNSGYSNAGHDFWLTRNGHGAGFWDGDWPATCADRKVIAKRWEGEAGDFLTKQAKTFGSFDLYVGDDGKIYA